MSIIFRADASATIGTGHVMRCLTLAEALRERGCKVSFICRDLPGNLNRLIADQGFSLQEIPASESCTAKDGLDWEQDALATAATLKGGEAAWLVVDHYGLDYRWHRLLRPIVRRIMVIDDLANRVHECDLLLDQNLYPNMNTRYRGLVPPSCGCFLGPRFALLRKEFREMRGYLRERDGVVRRILVAFGGSDPTGETFKVIKALKNLPVTDISISVVTGSANQRGEEVRRLCETMPNTEFFLQADNMARLINEADLAIGAAGVSGWERCFLGLPTVLIVVAANQAAVAESLAAVGAGWNLGDSQGVTEADITALLVRLLNSPDQVKTAGRNALQIMGEQSFSGLEELADTMTEDCRVKV